MMGNFRNCAQCKKMLSIYFFVILSIVLSVRKCWVDFFMVRNVLMTVSQVGAGIYQIVLTRYLFTGSLKGSKHHNQHHLTEEHFIHLYTVIIPSSIDSFIIHFYLFTVLCFLNSVDLIIRTEEVILWLENKSLPSPYFLKFGRFIRPLFENWEKWLWELYFKN